MSGLDPTGPSQPTQSQAYTTAGNPATITPAEVSLASKTARANQYSEAVDQRVPQQQTSEDHATEVSLGRGVRGAGAGEETKGCTEEVGRHNELDAEQMAAPGEGRIRDAVAGDTSAQGRSGEQEDLAGDLDRKKAVQSPAREAMKQVRKENVDVGGILGQRGGPAMAVDQDSYPNTSD